MSSSSSKHGLATQAIHSGAPVPREGDPLVLPTVSSTVFRMKLEGAAYEDVLYPRLSNVPNQTVVAARIASLEDAEAGLVTSSGMAAISTTLLTLLRPGDHVLVVGQIYGGTQSLLDDDLKGLGIGHTIVDPVDSSSWSAAVTPATRVVYTEAISNPLVRVADHQAVVRLAKDRGLTSVIDSTFASPVVFRPIPLGYDIVLHSATKYLNGHSDVVAGAVAGSATDIRTIHHRLNHLGGALSAEIAAKLERGMKTLTLRVERQCDNARKLAERLSQHPEVNRVHYPGLPSHPDHDHAGSLFGGKFGGMMSFELRGGADAGEAMMRRLAVISPSVSLGGVESLVTFPARSSHAGMEPETRRAAGINDGLIRLSVGIEDIADLEADLLQALEG